MDGEVLPLLCHIFNQEIDTTPGSMSIQDLENPVTGQKVKAYPHEPIIGSCLIPLPLKNAIILTGGSNNGV